MTATLTRPSVPAVDAILVKKHPVLDDGFIRVVDYMGDDAAIVQAARVSYGAGTKKVSEDRGLIRYLMAHRHTTPFEMCEIKLHIRIPMDAWRQFIRHRTANVNEYSTRYSEAIDARQTTADDEWRSQADKNKQGSGGPVTHWPLGARVHVRIGNPEQGWYGQLAYTRGDSGGWVSPVSADIHDQLPDGQPVMAEYRGQVQSLTKQQVTDGERMTPGRFLSAMEGLFHAESQRLYTLRLDFNVAREQARKDLPLSTYTEAYWKCDLHNLMHFLGLRMDSHAQKEIRDYANIMGEIVKLWVPKTWEAFEDFRLNATYLSGPELEVIKVLSEGPFDLIKAVAPKVKGFTKRELEGLQAKLYTLGFDYNIMEV